MLAKDHDISADVWSVTSYNELRRDGMNTDRWNMLNPTKTKRISYITQALKNESGVFVAASDYMKILPDSISRWIPGTYIVLGTDGFGRSETRESLRNHFEVDARYIVLATLTALMNEGKLDHTVVSKSIKKMGINPSKSVPSTA